MEKKKKKKHRYFTSAFGSSFIFSIPRLKTDSDPRAMEPTELNGSCQTYPYGFF